MQSRLRKDNTMSNESGVGEELHINVCFVWSEFNQK